MEILREVKKLGQEYRSLTGKPLGITGEVAEFEAAKILNLQLTTARQAGYDAIELSNGSRRKLQIKGRCVLEDSKRSQRVGRIKVDAEFDAVLLVLLDQNFDATVIYEADRGPVIAALIAPGSKARNEKGALAVSKFKAISRVRWKR
jgi:spore coat polysaccharide biosynthesis protein SpsF (cytidylyltransferase family)